MTTKEPEHEGEAIQLARQLVETRYGDKSLEIWRGDIVDLPVAQWVFSAFQGDYLPAGPTPWRSAWDRCVKRPRGEYVDGFWGIPDMIGGSDAVVTLPTQSIFDQQYPLIVVHFLGSRILRDYPGEEHSAPSLAYQRTYSELEFAFRQLSKQGLIAGELGMPILGSKLHGMPFETAIELQKEFAEDALQTIAGLKRLLICAHGEEAATQLNDAFRTILGRDRGVVREDLEAWISSSMETLSSRLSTQLTTLPEQAIAEEIAHFLHQLQADSIDLNNVAICARDILSRWLALELKQRGLPRSRNNLMQDIETLISAHGRPNRHLTYLHSLRVLGNTAAHQGDAYQPLRREDIVTLLLGVCSIVSMSAGPGAGTAGKPEAG